MVRGCRARVGHARQSAAVNDPLSLLAALPVWFVAFLFSTTCHEAAHGLVAKLGGDSTAHAGGQVTLDPTPHVKRHPFGMVVMPLLSYFLYGGGWMLGWASVPYDPHWGARYPKRAAWMSAAGPAANLALVVVAGLGIRAGMLAGWFEAPSSPNTQTMVAHADGVGAGVELLALALSVLLSVNLIAFAFNLLPIPPLDGSSVIGLFMSDDLHRRFRELFSDATISVIGLVAAMQLFSYVWNPLILLTLNLLYPEVGYRSGS